MKLGELIKRYTLNALDKVSRSQLAKDVSRLNSAARKRINRIKNTDSVYSPAEDYITRTGGFKKVRGQSLKELKNSFQRVKTFLESDTSTLKGARQYTQKANEALAQNIGVSTEELGDWMTETQRKRFFKVLDRALDSKQFAKGSLEYYRAMKVLSQEMESGDKRRGVDRLYKAFTEKLEQDYEEMQSNDNSMSTFF